MKKLIFIGCAVVAAHACAVQEKGYGERFKEKKDRFVESIKTAGAELYKCMAPEKKAEKGKTQKKLAYLKLQSEQGPVILESCEHCRDLCGGQGYQNDLV